MAVLEKTTQAEVAAAVNAKQQYVSSWARGVSRPEAHHREALERVYEIPMASWYSPQELAVARGRSAA